MSRKKVEIIADEHTNLNALFLVAVGCPDPYTNMDGSSVAMQSIDPTNCDKVVISCRGIEMSIKRLDKDGLRIRNQHYITSVQPDGNIKRTDLEKEEGDAT